MISQLIHIDSLVEEKKYEEIKFDTLRIIFTTYSKAVLGNFEDILKSDRVSFVTRRSFFKWKIIVDIPITDSYNKDAYQTIVGKFFMLAGRMYIRMIAIGLNG